MLSRGAMAVLFAVVALVRFLVKGQLYAVFVVKGAPIKAVRIGCATFAWERPPLSRTSMVSQRLHEMIPC